LRDLHPFPTRRSSDLVMSERVALLRVRAHRSSSPSPYMRMVVGWGPTVGPAMARSTYRVVPVQRPTRSARSGRRREVPADVAERSEEHTSELQSPDHL